LPDRNLSDRNLSDRNSSSRNLSNPNYSKAKASESNVLELPLYPGQPVGQSEALAFGAAYLARVRQLVPAPEMIACIEQAAAQAARASWIGRHIEAINAQLRSQLADCEACFYPVDRPVVAILAAPLAAHLGLDGLCSLGHQPVVLLIDVGRLAPPDWLGAVAHEYAHAVVGSPGHGHRFQQVLTHLCLGLGLPPPPTGSDRAIASWPPSQPSDSPTAFWQGRATGLGSTQAVRPT
jgi:hypothetical protein